MAIPESGIFPSGDAVRRFMMRLLGEHFSGFIDFDFAGRKRRLFFDEGKAFSAQSSVAGESILDILIARGKLRAEDKPAVLTLAREKKVPLEQAAIDSGKVPEKTAIEAMRGLVELLVGQSIAESTGTYKLTVKPGLLGRMKGVPVEMLALLAKEEVSDVALDPQVGNARREIREAFQKSQGLTHYQVLGVDQKATADEIRKKYFDLAKKWHTDAYAKIDIGDEAKAQLEALFAQIAEAFNTLSDPQKRADYDAIMERKAKGLPTDVGEIMRAEQLFKRGDSMLTRGQYEGALKDLAEAKTINPGEAEFWAAYGLALYFAEQKASEAIAAVQKAIEIRPQLARSYEALGRIYKGENDEKKAKLYLNKCLELDPKNVNAQRELRLMAMRSQGNASGKQEPAKKEDGGFLSKLFKK